MKNKILNIPIILTILRFFLVPVAVALIFSDFPYANLWAAGVVVLAYITDVLDGYIARHNHIVTDFGKLMDPAADKCMQIALFVCLSIKMPIIIPALVFLVLKDLSLAAGAGYLYKKEIVLSANWYGKVASFVTLFVLLAILIFRRLPSIWVIALISLTVVFNLVAIISYGKAFFHVLREKQNKGAEE